MTFPMYRMWDGELPDTVMGRAPTATSFSRTCIAIFPYPLTTHLGKDSRGKYIHVNNLVKQPSTADFSICNEYIFLYIKQLPGFEKKNKCIMSYSPEKSPHFFFICTSYGNTKNHDRQQCFLEYS